MHLQVNLCQKHLFLDQLTQNMTKDCSLIYQFMKTASSEHGENMGRACSELEVSRTEINEQSVVILWVT